MLNQEFALSTLTNKTFWLEADAELRSNSSSYGDYDAAPYAVSTAAGASAGASAAAAADAKPAAAKPAYGYGDAHVPEYDVDSDPTGGPELLGRGKVGGGGFLPKTSLAQITCNGWAGSRRRVGAK